MNWGTIARTRRALLRNLRYPSRLLNIMQCLSANVDAEGRVSYLPYSLDIEPTVRCNLRCSMCIHTHWKRTAPDMNLDQFQRLLNGIPTLVKVKLQGAGEPFLAPDFFTIVAECEKRGIMAHTITNGTTLSDEVIGRIYDSSLADLHISLDTCDKTHYERIRTGASFEEVIQNVTKLSRHRERKKLIISIWAVVWDYTVDDTALLVQFARDLGLDTVFLEFGLESWGIPSIAQEAGRHGVTRNSHFEEVIAQCQERARTGLRLVILPPSEHMKRRCKWPFKSSFVSCDGFVTPCCHAVDPSQFNFGNAFEQPFHTIWHSDGYNAFRKMFLNKEFPEICKQICFTQAQQG